MLPYIGRSFGSPAVRGAHYVNRLICRANSNDISSISDVIKGHYPVVICGGGPTGLTLSALLAQHGVPSALFERRQHVISHPQAHYINNRTMEVFRSMGGGLAGDVKALSPPLDQWRNFRYCETLLGQSFGVVDHFKGRHSPHDSAVSPEPVAHVSQNKVAALLLQRARQTGNHVFLGHTVSSCHLPADVRQGSTCLTADSHIHHNSRTWGSGDSDSSNSGSKAPYTSLQVVCPNGSTAHVTCDYAIVADGANSALREQLGITMRGRPAMQSLMNVHFSSAALARKLTDRPAMLYFAYNAQVIAVIVAHDLNTGEFVAQLPFFPPLQNAGQFTADVCRQSVVAAAGTQLPDLHIHSIKPWTMSAEVASSMQISGSVFLAGDAAHRFPPAGGFGQNTGIQDAHNLAWKLAAVLQGQAGSGLLGTYDGERRPVAAANCALSVANYSESLEVPKLLGLDSRAASVLTRTLTSPLAALLPSGAPETLFDAAVGLGRQLSGVRGPLRSWRTGALQRLFDSGSSLRLQFPKEDVGFVYGSVPASVKSPESISRSATEDSDRQRLAPYEATTAPGARLPHATLTAADGGSLSTLDLCGGGDTSLVLLLEQLPAAAHWVEAARKLADTGFNIHVCCIASPSGGPDHKSQAIQESKDDGRHTPKRLTFCSTEASRVDNSHSTSSSDTGCGLLIENYVDESGTWAAVKEVGQGGAILVRPDGHVAWRTFHSRRSTREAFDDLHAAATAALYLEVLAVPEPSH